MFSQALAELCEIKFGKTHPVCNLVSVRMDTQSYILALFFSLRCVILFTSLLVTHSSSRHDQLTSQKYL